MKLFSMEELVIRIISVEDNRNKEIPFMGYRLNFEILICRDTFYFNKL